MSIKTSALIQARMERGYEIIKNGEAISQVDENTFIVPSQSNNGNYEVIKHGNEFACSCPDYMFRGHIVRECKHIWAVKFWLAVHEKASEPEDGGGDVLKCKFCGSEEVVKYGKKGRKQRYKCKGCGKCFVQESAFRKMKNDPNVITMTLDLYYKGLSLRAIADHLEQIFGVKITHVTIYNWIKKYVKLISEYVKSLKPQLGNEWYSDEMMVKFHGDWKWLWNVMDKQTRYLLASAISENREVEDARKIFAKAKQTAKGQKPDVIITDGLPAYHDAFNKEFFTLRKPRTKHISHIRLRGDLNTNIMERFHGTRRDREKVVRGLKKEDTPFINGQDVFYNFVRKHMGLKGLTPAQASNIGFGLGRNKWLGLIKKVSSTQN